MIANRNELWGRVVAQELARSGVRDVCISPGSRSTPLVLGVHAEPALRITTHLDERSGAFFALGIAKATGRPAALICTSGTAAANYLPAVVEANEARVPLLVLTADRPTELHEVGANQAIDQAHLYGRHARWFVDVGLAQPVATRVRHLRALVCRATARAQASPAGAVHLNFPFQEPLEPTRVPNDVPEDWHQGDLEARDGRGDKPFLEIPPAILSPDPSALDQAAALLTRQPDGIIVAGPRSVDPEFAAALADLRDATGYALLADPLSGARYGTQDACASYDAWLANPERRAALRPRMVVRFGSAPTSKHLLAWLKELDQAEQIVVSEHPTYGEETTRATLLLAGSATTIARELASRLSGRPPSPLTKRILATEQATTTVLSREAPRREFEGAILQRVISSLADGAQVFVSSSLPVRDLDRFGHTAKRIHVYANRGASGIDGVTSTALGVAHASGKPLLLIAGDVAFLHDLSALVTKKRLGVPMDIVVFDNDGGGVFEFLPIAKLEPPFTDLFVTPHHVDIAAIGRAMDMRVTELSARKALRTKFPLKARKGGSLAVIKTDRKANVAHRRDLERLVDQALSGATGGTQRVR